MTSYVFNKDGTPEDPEITFLVERLTAEYDVKGVVVNLPTISNEPMTGTRYTDMTTAFAGVQFSSDVDPVRYVHANAAEQTPCGQLNAEPVRPLPFGR